MKAAVFSAIARAIEGAPPKKRSAEMHLQMIKYADELSDVSGREFCEGVGLSESFGTEFSKMKNISERLKNAGLDVSLI